MSEHLTPEHLKRILRIEKTRLDEEWERQPVLYFEYAYQLEEARAELESAKADLDSVEASKAREVREDPERFKLKLKPSEASIKEAVLASRAYSVARERVTDARNKIGGLQAMVTALDHRKKALEGLVYLHGQNYFSQPRVNGEELPFDNRKESRGKVRESLNKKR